jgi:hypothetical protein
MAGIAMMVGGALVNALAFTGSNFLFSSMGSNSANEERKRHDKAVENLQKAQTEWAERRTERLDWINNEIRKQNHAAKTFDDVDEAIREYNAVTAPVTSAQRLQSFQREPTLSDYYTPSQSQKDREIVFIVGGMVVVGIVAYRLV